MNGCGETLNLKRLDDVEGKKQYQVKMSNSFATLQNLKTDSGGYQQGFWKVHEEFG